MGLELLLSAYVNSSHHTVIHSSGRSKNTNNQTRGHRTQHLQSTEEAQSEEQTIQPFKYKPKQNKPQKPSKAKSAPLHLKTQPNRSIKILIHFSS